MIFPSIGILHFNIHENTIELEPDDILVSIKKDIRVKRRGDLVITKQLTCATYQNVPPATRANMQLLLLVRWWWL